MENKENERENKNNLRLYKGKRLSLNYDYY